MRYFQSRPFHQLRRRHHSLPSGQAFDPASALFLFQSDLLLVESRVAAQLLDQLVQAPQVE